jgi:hypothetical protein
VNDTACAVVGRERNTMSGGDGDTDADEDEDEENADECKRLAVDACREPCDGDDDEERAKSGVPDADWRAESVTPSPPSSFGSSASASASLANDASVAPALTGALAKSAVAELGLELGLDERAIAAAGGGGDDDDDSGARACSPPNEARREAGFDAPLSLLAALADAVSSAVALPAALDLAAAVAAVLALLALPLGSSAAPCLSPA